ncbi:MAG TPA: FHA domain-containing protein [Hyphomicrobiaceae bacterium]|nr:FHA domain-containing protein [Hyphomicrobiaceae bacterium]
MTNKKEPEPRPSAAEAAREARGARPAEDVTTRVLRASAPAVPARTQLIRGKIAVKRTEFHQDPVVGWLVVVGGPGLGAYRPVFEGNNTLGRASSQRVPIDFGDDTISSEEQAYIRYDGSERKFLLVPNLAKTNVVSVNDKRPTAAVELAAMDLITIGRTQLVFMPFCGPDFDWSELGELKS